MNERLEAALSYARRGWQVCPLHWPTEGPAGVRCSCGNGECESVGKHPLWDIQDLPDGIRSATQDEDRLRSWWGRWSKANLAIATGTESGLIAADIDPRHDGAENLAALERKHERLPETPQALTGGGGMHYLFQHPGGNIPNRTGKAALAPGVEIKGDGGYIVAPPSRHGSGNLYLWEASSHPDEVPLAPAPAWLLGLIRESKPVAAAAAAGGPIPQGGRNDALTRLAGAMRRQGMEPGEIEAALLAVNERRCVPPLAPEEVHGIADGMARYAPEEATSWRVGGRRNGAFTGIDPLRKIASDPPRYEATVFGEKLQLTAAELAEFKRFKVACLTRLDFIPTLPPPESKDDKTPNQIRWEREFLNPALRVMKEQGDFEAAPEDAGEFGAAWQGVLLFFRKMRRSEDRADLSEDKLIQEDGMFLFRGQVLRSWLAKYQLNNLKADELWAVIRNHGGKASTIRTARGSVWAWQVPDPGSEEECNA